jgi:hypothetical protein
MLITSRLSFPPAAMPRLKLGTRVLVAPGARDGIVVGIRYGEIAYDVLCGEECLSNLCRNEFMSRQCRCRKRRSGTGVCGVE